VFEWGMELMLDEGECIAGTVDIVTDLSEDLLFSLIQRHNGIVV
jgi:hypothetical protein